MICVPVCSNCSGLCHQMETRAVARSKTIAKIKAKTPNSENLVRMPCGCLALPVELVRVFKSNIYSFICDEHGEKRVTKAWLKHASVLGHTERAPSEYGYQVKLSDDTTD